MFEFTIVEWVVIIIVVILLIFLGFNTSKVDYNEIQEDNESAE